MSHFAKVENGIVTEVVVATKEIISSEVYGDEFLWVQTSYNNNFRGTFAAVGYTYDKELDIFRKPAPYPSWVWDDEQQAWKASIEQPEEIMGNCAWNEETTSWVEVNVN